MRIAVIGASGWLGGAIAREALSRGHQVTAMARNPGESSITSGDLAAAMVDELERPQFSRRRFTAAYAS